MVQQTKFFSVFDSFNKALKQEHDIAVSTINDHIDAIKDKGGIEGLIRIEDARQTGDIVELKLDLLVPLVPKMANIEQQLETIVDEARTRGQFQQDQSSSGGNDMLRLLTEQWDRKLRATLGMCHKNIALMLTNASCQMNMC